MYFKTVLELNKGLKELFTFLFSIFEIGFQLLEGFSDGGACEMMFL